MTDRTPHEALAQSRTCERHFLRVVTSNVSHWFAEQSTPNLLLDLPEDVMVVYGNKFYTAFISNVVLVDKLRHAAMFVASSQHQLQVKGKLGNDWQYVS